jgi:hypothetical protein
MSVLELDRLCRETLRDHAFRKAMQTEPEAAIARYRLTEAEKRALLAGDVVALHRMGVNDFLMGYLARFNICGLNIQVFSERIISAGPGPGH